MYKEPFVGEHAKEQPKRILILGESHHDLDSSTTTQKVVEDYLSPANTTKQSLQFFHKIALAFGVDTEKAEEKARLWDKVFFGNYINRSLDGPSGEGEDTAPKLIRKNNECYNQELAEYIREHGIDVVFCFSFRVFDALPPAPAACEDVFIPVKIRRRNVWCGRAYGPDSLFGRSIEIYGIPHPNFWRGFGAKDITKYLKDHF